MHKFILIWIIIVAAQFAVPSVHAQETSKEVFRGNAGDYEIVVSVQPVQPVVGNVHFSILTIDSQTEVPIQNARVTLFAVDETGKELFQAPALNSSRFPSFYQSNIKFESEGTWELSVEVDSVQLGNATASFPLDVGSQAFRPTNTGATIFFLFLVSVMLGGILYVWYSSKRLRRARAAQL